MGSSMIFGCFRYKKSSSARRAKSSKAGTERGRQLIAAPLEAASTADRICRAPTSTSGGVQQAHLNSTSNRPPLSTSTHNQSPIEVPSSCNQRSRSRQDGNGSTSESCLATLRHTASWPHYRSSDMEEQRYRSSDMAVSRPSIGGNACLGIDIIKPELLTTLHNRMVDAGHCQDSRTPSHGSLKPAPVAPAVQIHGNQVQARRTHCHDYCCCLDNGESFSSGICAPHHTETMLVQLPAYGDNNPGFTLHYCGGTNLPSGKLGNPSCCHPPVFATVEREGNVSRCGYICPGDCLLSINGKPTAGMSAAEVTSLLGLYAAVGCLLEIAFNVHGCVTVEEGTFCVKIKKSRGISLGVTVSSRLNDPDDQGLTVTHVEKGSLAYRLGCVISGDRLLAVNGRSLACCASDDTTLDTVRDSEGTVSLKLFRGSRCSVDNPSITYTVHLEKHSWSSLGITLAGSQDGSEPITISDMQSSSIASHAGLLHVGDTILSVNGVNMVGCRPSKAIQLLQLGDDCVTLQVQHTLRDACSTSLPADVKQCKTVHGDLKGAVAANSFEPAGVVSKLQSMMDHCSVSASDSVHGSWTSPSSPFPLSSPSSGQIALTLMLQQASTECSFGFSLLAEDDDREQARHVDVDNGHSGSGRGNYYVIAVQPSSAAERAGLAQYDRLLRVNNISVSKMTYDEVVHRVQAARVSRRITLAVSRPTSHDSNIVGHVDERRLVDGSQDYERPAASTEPSDTATTSPVES